MLNLDQAQEVELPAVESFTYGLDKFQFNCERAAPEIDRKEVKYVLHLREGGQKIARCTFFLVDECDPEIMFGGMFVEPEFQGKGVGALMIRELFYIAGKSGREFITAMRQRKPAMCVLLHRFGFEPVLEGNWSDKREQVDVARDDSGRTLLRFEHEPKGEQFRRSNIALTQGYCLVNNLDDARESPTRIYLNRLYLLVDEVRAQMMMNGLTSLPGKDRPPACSGREQTLVDRPLKFLSRHS